MQGISVTCQAFLAKILPEAGIPLARDISTRGYQNQGELQPAAPDVCSKYSMCCAHLAL